MVKLSPLTVISAPIRAIRANPCQSSLPVSIRAIRTKKGAPPFGRALTLLL